MPSRSYDVIIVGLGAVGSATAFRVAARGQRVLGLDRYNPPHTLGSSHGRSRIIREACFEHPAYVPLARYAYECWAELEQLTHRSIVTQTGGITLGAPDSVAVTGARLSATEHGLPYEELSAADIARRIPALRVPGDNIGIWDPRAGVVAPETAIECHLEAATRAGADLHLDEPVIEWRAQGDDIEVTTTRSTYRGSKLVLAVGAWISELLPDLELPLEVERQVMCWFRPHGHANYFTPQYLPIFVWEFERGRAWYGLPDLGHGVKIGIHHEGRLTTADSVDRRVGEEDEAAVRALVRRFLPDADGPPDESAVCLYTNTPDRHFLIDWHPAHRNVLIASPCSGHGFKYASAMGDVLADLALKGETRFDLSPFKMPRLSTVA